MTRGPLFSYTNYPNAQDSSESADQKQKRTSSWRSTIIVQRQNLSDNLGTSATLRRDAEAALAESYAMAVERAVDETGLPAETFPAECPWTLEQLLSAEVLDQ